MTSRTVAAAAWGGELEIGLVDHPCLSTIGFVIWEGSGGAGAPCLFGRMFAGFGVGEVDGVGESAGIVRAAADSRALMSGNRSSKGNSGPGLRMDCDIGEAGASAGAGAGKIVVADDCRGGSGGGDDDCSGEVVAVVNDCRGGRGGGDDVAATSGDGEAVTGAEVKTGDCACA